MHDSYCRCYNTTDEPEGHVCMSPQPSAEMWQLPATPALYHALAHLVQCLHELTAFTTSLPHLLLTTRPFADSCNVSELAK